MKRFKEAIIASIVAVALGTAIAWATTTFTGTFRYHVANNDSVDGGYVDLSSAATSTVTTRIQLVKSCTASLNGVATSAGTTLQGEAVYCNVPTQTGSNRGKILIAVSSDAGTASGTQRVNYVAVGQGSN